MQQGHSTERDVVGSLEKGLAVIEVLARSPGGLTLTETAAELGLSRAGARRLLITLAVSGYAVQAGRRFTLSPKLLSLARTWISGVGLWTYAEPVMREVTETLDESCSAAILAGEDVVYVARVPGRRIMSVALQVGTRLPAYCTAMGRVLLGGLDEAELAALLARAPLRQNTSKTLTSRDAVAAAVRVARDQGFALVNEELEIGLRSIAVPIRDRSGAIVAALNVAAQTSRCSVARMEATMLPPLRAAAQAIEQFFVAS